ncbi:MAG: hypothetical protein JOZ43_06455, partial [Acidobacteriales bacterium]|nr:hypothetical protein [Terriglobales bacterium]
ESGEKRLTFIDGDKRTGTTFHYSENPQIQRLTAYLQGIAATQDFARRAKLHRRFDKLALDEDVKQFAGEVQGGRATEINTIRPLLEELANDPAVLNTARERIKAMLAGRTATATN